MCFGVCVNRRSAPQSQGSGVGFAGVRMHVPTVCEDAGSVIGGLRRRRPDPVSLPLEPPEPVGPKFLIPMSNHCLETTC